MANQTIFRVGSLLVDSLGLAPERLGFPSMHWSAKRRTGTIILVVKISIQRQQSRDRSTKRNFGHQQ